MKIFKYQTDQQHETQLWVCNACKKANWEKILLKSWKLIDSDEASRHECGLCTRERQENLGAETSSTSRAA